DYWQQPITDEQLQSEMERMARHTKQPKVLRELFDALGNDPFVIAECLARQILADQLATDLSSHDRVRLNSCLAAENQMPRLMAAASRSYTLPMISDDAACSDDTWTATNTANAPSARPGHTAVWTGIEMIVWGGYNLRQIGAAPQIDGSTLNTGGS